MENTQPRKKRTLTTKKKYLPPNLKTRTPSPQHANSSCNSISKANQPNRKQARDLNGHYLFKEGIHVATKHVRRCSASLLEKCQSRLQQGISLLTRNDHPPKGLQRLNCCPGQGEQGALLHCGRGCRWVGTATTGKTAEAASNSVIQSYHLIQPAHPCLRSQENHNLKWHLHPYFRAALLKTSRVSTYFSQKWHLKVEESKISISRPSSPRGLVFQI